MPSIHHTSMDSSPSAQSPDVTESRPSFRRPANDASRRNYRRHSPSTSRSPSPPSPGGWKRDRSPSHRRQDADGLKRGRRLESESEAGKGDDGQTRRREDSESYFDHRSQSRDRYGKSDDYNYNYSRRHSGHYDRSYHSHSMNSSARDSHTSVRADYYRRDDGRHSRDPRSAERASRGRGNDENRERRRESRTNERDRDREKYRIDDRDRYRSEDWETGVGRGKSGAKRIDKDMDADIDKPRDLDGKDRAKGKDYDYHRDRDGHHGRYRHRDKEEIQGGEKNREKHESKADRERMKESFKEPGRPKGREEWKERDSVKDEDDYKNRDGRLEKDATEKDLTKLSHAYDTEKDGDILSQRMESKSEQSIENTLFERDSSEKREKGIKHTSEHKNMDYPSSDTLSKSEDVISCNPRGSAATVCDHVDASRRSTSAIGDDKILKGTKWGPAAESSSEAAAIASSEAETVNDLNNAKMAAMRAAELVNKNLGAGGFMSADQKKRLLWGSKQQESVTASGANVWDTVRFADRERQEKFHKLMGVKGDAAAVNTEKIVDKPSGGLFTAEKQEELQQDLEKQFTAGLRRRDGRTVGLGL